MGFLFFLSSTPRLIAHRFAFLFVSVARARRYYTVKLRDPINTNACIIVGPPFYRPTPTTLYRHYNSCTKICACILTLTSRPNVTMSCFIPDVVFSVDLASNRPAATDGVTAGLWPVLDFRYQPLYEGATAARFQVHSHSCASITLLNTGPFAQDIFNRVRFLLPPGRGCRRPWSPLP